MTHNIVPDSGGFQGKVHHFPVRVYYENTDFGGIVYHAEYLKFMERARTEFLRALDIHQNILAQKDLYFVVYHLEISYLSSATLDDSLVVKTQLCRLKGVGLVLSQKIYKGDKLLIECTVKLCVINALQKPQRLPKETFSTLNKYLLNTV